jgi:hypothetical protein
LPIASSLAATSSKHFSLIVSILKGDVIGMYLGGSGVWYVNAHNGFAIVVLM